MNYGFVINNDTCIGCHACSTACKSENEVPLGVHRTWVKSVEAGTYPNVRRHFQVTRCNHCGNPPCVQICPVTAMYQRDDGIVEFDSDACIGCKACLQACPYDAIYVDPDTGTAAKCHYCAHRTDIGLEPACVVVCPEHAIIAGDLDDPESEISRTLSENKVTVRKPEQGTAPKLFYISGSSVTLNPAAVESEPTTFAWADSLDRDGGPITVGEGRMAGHLAGQMAQVVYNTQHRMPWHWPVPAYLVTKAIGSGIALWLALGLLLGLFVLPPMGAAILLGVSLLFTAATTALLVFDLERPERFLRILTRPQWRSWLTRGAFILIAFSLVTTLWFLLELAGAVGGHANEVTGHPLRFALALPTVPLALGAAVYTAFLFGQAEGRDLWQSSLLPVHLVVQALLAGTGAMLAVAAVAGGITGGGVEILTEGGLYATRVLFIAALIVDLLVTFLGEFGMSHASDGATRAARDIRSGRYRMHFWAGSLVIGHVGPLLLAFAATPATDVLAGLLAVAGLYFYEYAFVMAPQHVANS